MMFQKYDRIFDDVVMGVSTKKSHYNVKSHRYDGFGSDRGLS